MCQCVITRVSFAFSYSERDRIFIFKEPKQVEQAYAEALGSNPASCRHKGKAQKKTDRESVSKEMQRMSEWEAMEEMHVSKAVDLRM